MVVQAIEPMRMAFLSIHSSPLGKAGGKDTGGMSTYLRGLSRALGEAGHRIDLFTRPVGAAEDTVRKLSPNVRLVRPEDGLGPLAKNEIYPYCDAIAESIDRFCRRENGGYHFIFSHYWLSAVVGQNLRQSWNIPHLVMFHTLGRAKNESCPGENEPLLRLKVEEDLARKSDLLVAAAKQEKEKLLRYFAPDRQKIAVIPCGIDRTLFRPLDPRCRRQVKQQIGAGKQKIILAVGRIEPVKGFDLLLKAAALLPAEDNFKLLIIGGDGQSSTAVGRLKETAAALGLAGKVHFTGVVDHDLLPLYYNAADVTVLASFYESCGLVALESLACGTPVAAAPVGIVPELLYSTRYDSFGCLINGRNPESWAAKIRELLLRPEKISPAEIDTRLAPYNWANAASGLESAMRGR